MSAIFDGQLTANVTQKVRKANKLLLEVLVERYGVEILIARTNKLDWIKQLKAIAKIRLVFNTFPTKSFIASENFYTLKLFCVIIFESSCNSTNSVKSFHLFRNFKFKIFFNTDIELFRLFYVVEGVKNIGV